MKHAAHFGYPYYWGGPLLWGMSAYPAGPLATEPSASPGASPAQADVEAAAKRAAEEGDAHLRSGLEVIGYVDTTKWWPGGHVRVHPEDVERIDWENRKVHLRLTRDEVQRSARA